MPLPPQAQQQAQRPRRQGRSHKGLKAHSPHLKVCMGGQIRQLPGEGIVIVRNGVGDDQVLSMGAEAAAVREVLRKTGIPFSIVGRPSVHHPQAEALHLVGKQASAIQDSIFIPVALQQHRPAQGIHRIADHAKQALIPGRPGLFRVQRRQVPVQLVLSHAHVSVFHRRIRHEPGRAEQEYISIKQLLRPDDLHRRQSVICPGQADLIHLKFPPLGHVFPQVADANRGDDIPAQQPQTLEQRAAHVPQAQEVHPVFSPPRWGAEQLLPAGVQPVHGSHPSRPDGLLQLRRDGRARGGGIQGLHALLLRQQGRVRHGKALPAREHFPGKKENDLSLLRQGAYSFIGQRVPGAEGVPLIAIVVHTFASFVIKRIRLSSSMSSSR